MKNKKNLGTIIILSIVGLLIIFSMLIKTGEQGENSNETSGNIDPTALSEEVKEWYETTKKDEYVVTVIGLSYCGYCKQYKPVIEEITDDENIAFYYFDFDTLAEASSKDADALEHTYDLENYTGSSPYTFITKNGEFIGDTVGYMDKDETTSFLKSLKVIK